MNAGDDAIEPLDDADAAQLLAGVLCRIMMRDRKGRPFCTPRNPRTPTIDEFNPRIGVVSAGALSARIGGRRHGIFLDQAARVRQLTDADLLAFRTDDPMSGYPTDGTFLITGGHHRLNEIQRRVEAGELAAETRVRILFHDSTRSGCRGL